MEERMRRELVSVHASRCARAVLFGLFASVAAPSALGAQEALPDEDAQLIAALRDFIPHVVRIHNTPGLSIALARRGEVIWSEGFGYADMARRTPMTARTVTRSGSMGKLYTATAVLQLVERGILDLDAPINRYIMDFRIENLVGGREVTVRDLLTHRSGLAPNAANSDFVRPPPLRRHLEESYSRTSFKPYAHTLPMWTARPGERYQYSNLGTATLGYLVEVTNPERLSFSEYVQEHIIDPLGMTSTMYPPVQDSLHVRPDIFQRMSTGYAQFGTIHVPTPPIYFADFPAGTVVTVPADHVRLLLAMLNEGTLHGYQLLRPETVREALSPQVATGGGRNAVGLMWQLADMDSPTRSFGHGGAHMWGWTNRSIAFPELDVALTISMNHWPIPPDARSRYGEASRIIDFVTGWLQRSRERDHLAAERSWGWKYSYVAGLMLAERLGGMLGITTPLTPLMVEDMVKGTRLRRSAGDGVVVWEPAGFRAGLDDLASIHMSRDSIAEFLQSDRLRILPEELDLLVEDLGGNAGLPFRPPEGAARGNGGNRGSANRSP
jgi:CubicO group peptidase (beta-lactamase class C family)